MTHSEECGFLTSLIIDLKKRELGHAYTPIPMARLEEASRMIGKIQQCRTQALFRSRR